MSEHPGRMPVRSFLQRRFIAAETLLARDRWMLSRLPGGPALVLGASLVVAVIVAGLRPDLGRLTLGTGAALLALLAVAMLSQLSGLLVAAVVVPAALVLPLGTNPVPRVVAAVGLLLLVVGVPRAQRWFATQLLDDPRGRATGPLGLALASAATVGGLLILWAFVLPPMILGAAIRDPADLTMSPLPALTLGVLAAGIGFLVALTVQTRAGVAPDVPLLANPAGSGRGDGDRRLVDPTDDEVRDELRHLATVFTSVGTVLLGAEAVAVAAACPPDGDRDAGPRITSAFARLGASVSGPGSPDR